MSIAAQTASALGRASVIAAAAVMLSAPLHDWLASRRGWFGWALLLAPFLTPSLLVSYAYSRFALALVVSPRSHHALYAALLFLKLVPVAAVVRWMMPPPLSAEARHCHRMLTAPSFFGRAKFHLRGAGPGAWFAGGLVFLLAFADFEVASLWSIKTWTVAIFDAQTGGMNLRETLRLAALPVGVQVLVLVLLLVRVAMSPMRSGARGAGNSLAKFAFAYLALAALVVCVLPLIVVASQAAAGLPAIAENFVLGNEIGASVMFAVGASVLAGGVIRGTRFSKTDLRFRFEHGRKVREGGTPSPTLGTSVLPGVPDSRAELRGSSKRAPAFQEAGGEVLRTGDGPAGDLIECEEAAAFDLGGRERERAVVFRAEEAHEFPAGVFARCE